MTTNKAQAMKKLINKQERFTAIGLASIDAEPWIECRIGDRTYKLEFSLMAVQEVYQKTELTIGLEMFSPEIIAKHLGVLLLAGLRTHHSEEFGEEIDLENERNTERSIMRKISVRHLPYYTATVSKAMTAVQPDPEQIAEIMGDLMDDNEADERRPLVVVPTSEASGLSHEISESLELT